MEEPCPSPGKIRTFDTGATRDTDAGKPDYEGFLSPLVIKRFGEYMTRHRVQSDGSLRASDNWQRGISMNAYMQSMWRHMMDVWLIYRGHADQAEATDMDEALCALLFNVMGLLFENLLDPSQLAKIQEQMPRVSSRNRASMEPAT